jgi:precorrin-2 methylase
MIKKRNGKKTVEAANFTHSNRKAWKMLKKLGTVAIPASRQKSITANDIASRLLRVSKTQRNREHVRTTKMNLRRKKRTLTVNQTLSRIQEKLKCVYSTSTRMLPTNNWM